MLDPEKAAPEQYGVQMLVNADSPSAYWHFDEDYPLRDSEQEARGDLADALDYGYAAEHVRVVAISVLPPGVPMPDADNGLVVAALGALDRLHNQALHAAGDDAGRERANNDYRTITRALDLHFVPPEGGDRG